MMSASGHASCTLCNNSRGRRISPDLAAIYQNIIETPKNERKHKINSLFDSYPICAIARIAVVYGSKELADVMMSRFDVSYDSLPRCNHNGCCAQVSNLSICELTGAVYNYVHGEHFNTADEVAYHRVNSVESVFGVTPPDYDALTEQAMQLERFKIPEPIELRIISSGTVWAREEARKSRARESL